MLLSVQALLQQGILKLKQAKIPSANLDAELLLAHVLKKDRVYLIAHSEASVSKATHARYLKYIQQRAKHIPVAYIVRHKDFYGLQFKVTPAVLIPRPETELLVDEVLIWLKDHPKANSLIDIGVGSGAIPLSLAYTSKQLKKVAGTDISSASLAVARSNAKTLKLTRVNFKKADLLTGIKDRFDIITANLPYLSAEVYRDAVKRFPEIKREPKGALYAPKAGLAYIESLLKQAPQYLKPHGAIFLEIGSEQGEAVEFLAVKYLPGAGVEVIKDGCGMDRVVIINLLK